MEMADCAKEMEECSGENNYVPQLVRAEEEVESMRKILLRELKGVDYSPHRVQTKHTAHVGETESPHWLSIIPAQKHVPTWDQEETCIRTVCKNSSNSPKARGIQTAVETDQKR